MKTGLYCCRGDLWVAKQSRLVVEPISDYPMIHKQCHQTLCRSSKSRDPTAFFSIRNNTPIQALVPCITLPHHQALGDKRPPNPLCKFNKWIKSGLATLPFI